MSHDLDACGEHLKDVEGAILALHTHREGRTQKSLTAFLWGPVQFSMHHAVAKRNAISEFKARTIEDCDTYERSKLAAPISAM